MILLHFQGSKTMFLLVVGPLVGAHTGPPGSTLSLVQWSPWVHQHGSIPRWHHPGYRTAPLSGPRNPVGLQLCIVAKWLFWHPNGSEKNTPYLVIFWH